MEETQPLNGSLQVKQLRAPRQLHMTRQVLTDIVATIGIKGAETGGILGGCRESCEVTRFYFDDNPRHRSSVLYEPNTARTNEVKRQWQQEGRVYLGHIHSHPPSIRRPSGGDEEGAKRVLEVLDVPYILMPIVTTLCDTGSLTLYPFAAVLDGGRVKMIEQELVVDGILIRPARPASSHLNDGVARGTLEEDLLAIVEMNINMAALFNGGCLPGMGMRPPYQRRRGYHGRMRFDDEWD
jgi:Prokaryotic homologs of the JAB domain